MYKKYYHIADIVIEILSPFPFYSYNAEDFVCEPCKPDYRFRFEEISNIPRIMEGATFIANLRWAHEYKKENTYMRAFLWQEHFYSAVSIMGETEGICYYASSEILLDTAKTGFELFMYLCMERIFLQFHALVLHSSHIAVNGKGLVFSAPSQTGKSTQAELWRKYENAVVLNGDRSVLRKIDGIWQVCGCPMCGTSNIHKQGKEPLSNIVMLAQGPENRIRKISGIEAFKQVYPQITVQSWDRKLFEQTMELLNDLLEEIPVWHYTCTKEYEAVQMLKEVLSL